MNKFKGLLLYLLSFILIFASFGNVVMFITEPSKAIGDMAEKTSYLFGYLAVPALFIGLGIYFLRKTKKIYAQPKVPPDYKFPDIK